MSHAPALRPSSLLQRALNFVERLGNALPNPSTLFVLLSALVIVLSWVCRDVQILHPATQQMVQVVNLLSLEGLQRVLTNLVPNFVNFPPLGTVLACLVGIAVAERTGLITALLRLIVLNSPPRLLTPMVIFGGILSHAGGDIGYVLFIPLGAALFHAVGRHPLAGLAAAFAGVSGGFSANLLLGTIDPLLAGITQAAAASSGVRPGYVVHPTANYYFLCAATFLLSGAGWWVTEKIVEPRLGRYEGDAPRERIVPLTHEEKRGLTWAALTLAGLAAFVLAGLLPEDGFLNDPAKPGFLNSFFMRGMIFFIFFAGLSVGLAYGLGARTVRSDHDVVKGMDASMATMGSYIVMSFFTAQFLALFAWTNLGTILAIQGAATIQALGLHDSPTLLMVKLVAFTALVNLLIGSASAKWALFAPIFVPMFMLLGYSPELVQGAYRVGDSCTNIITPLMAYFPLIATFAARYVPQTGIGTLIATMLPYSVTFLVVWTLMLIGWIAVGLPMGPGAPLFLEK